jgi:hypothetical protein
MKIFIIAGTNDTMMHDPVINGARMTPRLVDCATGLLCVVRMSAGKF